MYIHSFYSVFLILSFFIREFYDSAMPDDGYSGSSGIALKKNCSSSPGNMSRPGIHSAKPNKTDTEDEGKYQLTLPIEKY